MLVNEIGFQYNIWKGKDDSLIEKTIITQKQNHTHTQISGIFENTVLFNRYTVFRIAKHFWSEAHRKTEQTLNEN